MNIANNKHGQPISINEVKNINEIFYCPNCGCKMRPRSIGGKNIEHFSAIDHHTKPDCNERNKYIDLEINNIEKSPLENILRTHHNNNESKTAKNNSKTEKIETVYIHTPNQLYNFCKYNSRDTEYMNDLKIRDILITENSLSENENYKGIEGIKLVKATFHRYENQIKGFGNGKIFFVCEKKYSSGKSLKLNIETVFPNKKTFFKIKDIILNTEEIKNHKQEIVIFGDFQISHNYHSRCNIDKQTQIILHV